MEVVLGGGQPDDDGQGEDEGGALRRAALRVLLAIERLGGEEKLEVV